MSFRSHTGIVVALLSATTDVFLAWQDGTHTEDLLRLVFMGWQTKKCQSVHDRTQLAPTPHLPPRHLPLRGPNYHPNDE